MADGNALDTEREKKEGHLKPVTKVPMFMRLPRYIAAFLKDLKGISQSVAVERALKEKYQLTDPDANQKKNKKK